jgi:hypothetical protein
VEKSGKEYQQVYLLYALMSNRLKSQEESQLSEELQLIFKNRQFEDNWRYIGLLKRCALNLLYNENAQIEQLEEILDPIKKYFSVYLNLKEDLVTTLCQVHKLLKRIANQEIEKMHEIRQALLGHFSLISLIGLGDCRPEEICYFYDEYMELDPSNRDLYLEKQDDIKAEILQSEFRHRILNSYKATNYGEIFNLYMSFFENHLTKVQEKSSSFEKVKDSFENQQYTKTILLCNEWLEANAGREAATFSIEPTTKLLRADFTYCTVLEYLYESAENVQDAANKSKAILHQNEFFKQNVHDLLEALLNSSNLSANLHKAVNELMNLDNRY